MKVRATSPVAENPLPVPVGRRIAGRVGASGVPTTSSGSSRWGLEAVKNPAASYGAPALTWHWGFVCKVSCECQVPSKCWRASSASFGEFRYRPDLLFSFSQETPFLLQAEITAGKSKTKFTLAGGQVKEIEVGIYQEPREIIFGQPPEADFGYIPDSPAVGAIVSFSGGLSSDPDGEITKYEWDFQSDGEIDRLDKIVSWRFENPGSYDVTLTVIDNEGNQATVTKTLEVVPKSS